MSLVVLRVGDTPPGRALREPDSAGFSKNRKKRAALAKGFRKTRGKIVITVDSDSVIEHGTLLALASPFKRPRVGSVVPFITSIILAY